jgi:hypothetical protein
VALSPDLHISVDELVLDGVEPEDALVQESLAQALGPALAAQGLEAHAGQITAATSAAVAREVST